MPTNMSPKQRAILDDPTLPDEVRKLCFVLWTRCYNTMSMIEEREIQSVIEQARGLVKEIPELLEKVRV